jgi:hypothetical protein
VGQPLLDLGQFDRRPVALALVCDDPALPRPENVHFGALCQSSFQ